MQEPTHLRLTQSRVFGASCFLVYVAQIKYSPKYIIFWGVKWRSDNVFIVRFVYIAYSYVPLSDSRTAKFLFDSTPHDFAHLLRKAKNHPKRTFLLPLFFSAIFSTFLHRKIGCRHAKERSGATEENDGNNFPFFPRGEFKAFFPLALLLKKVRETVKEEKWEKKKSCFLLSPPFPTLSTLQKVKGKRRRFLKLEKNTEKGLFRLTLSQTPLLNKKCPPIQKAFQFPTHTKFARIVCVLPRMCETEAATPKKRDGGSKTKVAASPEEEGDRQGDGFANDPKWEIRVFCWQTFW